MKKVFALVLTGMLLWGCKDSEDDIDDNDLIQIGIASQIVPETKVGLQNTQIVAGQRVSFFVTRVNNIHTVDHANVPATADGAGNFSFTNPIYYPLGAINVDFYAIQPYNSEIELDEIVEFEVQADQTTDKGYLDSDLLYAKATNLSKSRDAVLMNFTHKLTKVTFRVIQGDGTSLSTLTNIQIQNIYRRANMNPEDGVITSVQENASYIDVNGVRGSGEGEIKGMQAIVVPQVFTTENGKALLQVSINGNEYLHIPTTDITFEAGKCYDYTITVYENGIRVDSDVSDWLIEEE